MRGFFAVARREMAERRSVLAAAAVLSILPLLAPLFPLWRRFGAPEARLYAAAFLAVAFVAAVSLLLGASAFGRDLSEQRLAFYFARPIGGVAIWAGRLAGAWLPIALSAAIILFPAGLLAWRDARAGGLPGDVAVALAWAALVFLALGNLVSLAFRARPVRVAADLACLALWTLAMGFAAWPLLFAHAPVLILRVALAALAAGSVALLAAVGAQVVVGRVDAIRGGRARFAVLWVLLFALAGLAFGYARWLLSPAPEDLREIGIEAAAPRGSWIGIEGYARGRLDLRASLFYDVASGRFLRGRAGREGAIAFSGDGTAAAWTERAGLDVQGGPQDVWICRFDAGQIRRVRTPISMKVENIAMSPGGSRLAVMEEKTISVFEVPSGRLLASAAKDPARHYLRMVFLTERTLRISRMDPLPASAAFDEAPGPGLASIGIVDFEIDARKVKETATIANLRRTFSLAFNDLGERLIVWEKGGQVSLFDASTGRRLATLGPGGWDAGSRGAFLSDGRPIIAESTGGNGRVHLFSKEGREEHVFDLGRVGVVQLGGEPASGQIALAIGAAKESGTFDAFLLDLNSGAVRKLGAHLFPIAAHMRWRLPMPEPGGEVTRLFARADGSIVRLDPQTDASKAILPKR
jgi:hypothetical protein